MSFFYPNFEVTIGNYIFHEGIRLQVRSSKEKRYDWARIELSEKLQHIVTLTKGDEVEVRIGYQDLESIFIGSITEINNNQFLAKDWMTKLEETKITNTFTQATPQEVLKVILERAGIGEYELSQTPYPMKKVFLIVETMGIKAIEVMQSAFKIQEKFFFRGEKFYWGTQPEQEEIYEFVYGENIISLGSKGKRWELETISVPFIHHGEEIKVEHPDINGEFEVCEIVFEVYEDGFIRTKLYFDRGE